MTKKRGDRGHLGGKSSDVWALNIGTIATIRNPQGGKRILLIATTCNEKRFFKGI